MYKIWKYYKRKFGNPINNSVKEYENFSTLACNFITLQNTSSYTTLDVTLVSSPSSSVINIFTPSLDVTLETTTYNCLWLLLIVIANDIVKGNCLRWNLKGILTSEGDRDNLNTKTWSDPRKGDSHLKIHSQLHNSTCKERNNKSMHRK